MTQTELNLDNELVPCFPKRQEKGWGFELEVKAANCLPLNAKVEDVPESASCYHAGKNTGVSRTNRVAFSIDLEDGTPFNPFAEIAARRTYFVDGDERYETKRRALVNAARLAVANGLCKLPGGYTLEDLNNLKGFRWSPKAGCSMCPCSPAFMSPLFVSRDHDVNWFNFSFKVKMGQGVATMLDKGVVEQLVADPTLAPFAR